MKLRFYVAFLLAACASLAPASADLIYIDFGGPSNQTAYPYNNVTHTMDPISNLTQFIPGSPPTGAGTGIGLTTTGFNELGPNTGGTTSPSGDASALGFVANATRDSLFGHSTNFNAGSPRPIGILEFFNLDPSLNYSFTFFASRMQDSDPFTRETKYSVFGLTNGEALLNATNNTSNVAVVSGIKALANGTLKIDVSAGPNNNTSDQFYYLGALRIDVTAVPEPTSSSLVALGLMTFYFRSFFRRRS